MDKIFWITKRKGGYELKLKWVGLEEDEDVTWELLENILDKSPGISEEVLHMPGERDMEKKVIEFIFR